MIIAILTAVAGVAATAPGSTALAHTGQGNATPANDGWHPWATDGCSTPGANVNSVWGIYNFRHACVHHDGCYTGFPRNGQATYWVSRAQCDAWFLSDMRASCRWQHGSDLSATWRARSCNTAANTYYGAVRAAGWWAYKGPWRN
ncbi:MAG: phospholipase A2 [Desertimonas sp.]